MTRSIMPVLRRTSWISGISALCALMLIGCSTMGNKAKLTRGDLTMTQIYEQTAGLSTPAELPTPQFQAMRPVSGILNAKSHTDYVGYTRNAQNEVNTLFKPLPNPMIPVYVYPHLAQLGTDIVPIPGYTTSFFLYNQPYFALPSEQY